jgi:hypothetical protein
MTFVPGGDFTNTTNPNGLFATIPLLLAGDSVDLTLRMQINANAVGNSIINVAEIVSANG